MHFMMQPMRSRSAFPTNDTMLQQNGQFAMLRYNFTWKSCFEDKCKTKHSKFLFKSAVCLITVTHHLNINKTKLNVSCENETFFKNNSSIHMMLTYVFRDILFYVFPPVTTFCCQLKPHFVYVFTFSGCSKKNCHQI